MPANRYYSGLRERKVTNPAKKAVGGTGSAKAGKSKTAPEKGFPSCVGSGGTFGKFNCYVGEALR